MPNNEVLEFIAEKAKQYELTSGNCGILAIALNEKFNFDSFVFVENDAEPERIYHVGAVKDGIMYDGNGVTTLDMLEYYGFDDDYPDSEIHSVTVPATSDFYRYINKGTEPNIEVSDLLSNKAEVEHIQRLSGIIT